MGARTYPNRAEMLAVMRLLADVAALKGDPPTQRQVLIDGLNALVGTTQSFLYVIDGWRPGGNPRFVQQTLTADRDPVFLQYMADFGTQYPLEADPFCDRSLGDPRPLQARTFDDVLPDRETVRRYPAFCEVRRSGRVSDGVVSFYRTPQRPDRIAGVGMHQFGDAGPIRPRQRALVKFAVAEVRDLVARGHLELVPREEQGLSPRARQVLERLLAGQAPKAIARAMGLSVWTVREHVQRIYRKYGVSGRDELMARFVRP